MTTVEIGLVILVALAAAARIAGARFFDGLGDVRATADGMRCRMASWTLSLVAGFVALLYKDFSVAVNIIGGVCIVVSIGGLRWEYIILMNYIAETHQK